ncbi:MAG: hypothetical protein HOP12_03005 [Candidatus Eisenbacteria bacterium]|uniref:Uncharacterized protein n=1 Tax=Eiseniibacteriota bacterium TaxID=2212470 RepID=A0A849SVB1_UNCEI|nr:hypothetical protein [Candidatus Eisenbacteria bacterium]
MHEVSTFRLYLLRATYLLIAVGLAFAIWPGILDHDASMTLMRGVVHAMLGAVSLLALLGVRYPLQMIPVLLFELVWKTLWLLAFALPLWLSHQMDPRTMESVFECLLGVVIVPIALPWGYLWRHYVKKSGDHWRRATT